jgi:hypothetical protein
MMLKEIEFENICIIGFSESPFPVSRLHTLCAQLTAVVREIEVVLIDNNPVRISSYCLSEAGSLQQPLLVFMNSRSAGDYLSAPTYHPLPLSSLAL